MSLTPKENFLAAINYEHPEYVPLATEGVPWGFQFVGNFRGVDWTDLWGVGWQVGLPGTVPFPKHNPLPDLDRLADYRFPNPADLQFTPELRDQLAKVDRGRHVVVGWCTYLLFERAWAIMGMDHFLASLITHPAAAHAFLHGIATFTRGVYDRYLELGVDAVMSSEDLGTQRALMISPAMFREFLLPEYAFAFANVQRAGKLVFFHSCGCVDAIAGDLAGIGVKLLNPVQARANDLRRIKQASMGRMALDGAIDTALLARGTPAQVRAEVIRVMALLKPGGGYICNQDQGIPGIPEANLKALWDTARDVGRYGP